MAMAVAMASSRHHHNCRSRAFFEVETSPWHRVQNNNQQMLNPLDILFYQGRRA
jgi:hypothetical protein